MSVAVSMSFCASKSSGCRSKTSRLSLLQFFSLLSVTVTKQPPVRPSLPLFFHLSGNADCFLLLKCCDDLQNLLVECRLLVKMSKANHPFFVTLIKLEFLINTTFKLQCSSESLPYYQGFPYRECALLRNLQMPHG